jgi:hypothetical protein
MASPIIAGAKSELQTENEKPRKSDPTPTTIDPLLDDPRSDVAIDAKRGWPFEAVRH